MCVAHIKSIGRCEWNSCWWRRIIRVSLISLVFVYLSVMLELFRFSPASVHQSSWFHSASSSFQYGYSYNMILPFIAQHFFYMIEVYCIYFNLSIQCWLETFGIQINLADCDNYNVETLQPSHRRNNKPSVVDTLCRTCTFSWLLL